MMNFRIRNILFLITAMLFTPATSFGNSAYEVDILDTRQLGHVRHIVDSAPTTGRLALHGTTRDAYL